MFEINWPVFSQ